MPDNNPSLKIVIEKLTELMSGKIPDKIQPFESNEYITELTREINLLIDYFEEISNFIVPLSKGILNVNRPRTKNFLASPFKELHSQLLNLTWQAEEIAKTKMPDLTAADLDAAVRTIAGSARSMGITVEGV